MHRDLRESSKRNIAADYKLAGSVPWNSSVVATEATAPLVSGRVRNVDYYPINLKSDDYVLIHSISPCSQPFLAYQMVDYSSNFGAKLVSAGVTHL